MAYTDDIVAALETVDVERAVDLLAANKAAHGAEADFYVVTAMVAMTAGDAEVAIDALASGLAAYPNNGDMLFSLGNVYYGAGQLKEAWGWYQKARPQLSDAAALEQLDALLAAIASAPGFSRPVELTVLTREDLGKMSFARGMESPGDFGYLMRRIEFGAEMKKSIEAMKRALQAGKVTRQQIKAFIQRTPTHEKRLMRVLNERL